MTTSLDSTAHSTTEDPADRCGEPIAHWIDGAPYATTNPRLRHVSDPATGRLRARVAFADETVVDTALDSAFRALAVWRDTPLSRRIPVLQRFRELLSAH